MKGLALPAGRTGWIAEDVVVGAARRILPVVLPLSLALLAASELAIKLVWIARQTWPVHYDSFHYLALFRGWGLPAVPAFKVVVGVIFAAFGLVGAAAVWKKDRLAAAMFLYLAWSSHGLFATEYGFVQQSAGMLFLLGSMCMPCAPEGATRRRAAWIALSLLACIHKSTAVLFVLALLFKSDGSPRLKRGIAAVSILAFVVLSARHFPDVHRYFTAHTLSGFADAYRARDVSPQPVLEALLYGALTIAMAVHALIRKDRFVLLLCGLVALMNLPLWAHDNARWFQTSLWVFFLALCETLRRGCLPWLRSALGAALVCCIAAKMIVSPDVRVGGPKLDASRIAGNAALLSAMIEQDAIVVAPSGVDYQVQYFLRRRTLLNPPGSTDRALWIIQEKNAEATGCARIWDGESADGASCVELDPKWVALRRRLAAPAPSATVLLARGDAVTR